MLLHSFPSLASLFSVPQERLKDFRCNGTDQDHRTVRCPLIFETDSDSEQTVAELEEIAAEFGVQRSCFLDLFSMKIFRRCVIGDRRRQIRDQLKTASGIAAIENQLKANALTNKSATERARLAAKTAAAQAGGLLYAPVSKINPVVNPKLPMQLRESALDTASATVKAWLRSLQTATLVLIRTGEPIRNYQKPAVVAASQQNGTSGGKKKRKPNFWESLSDEERGYIYDMLSGLTERFFDMLDGKNPPPVNGPSAGITAARRLCDKMRRCFRRAQGSIPRHGEDRSIAFDESCYNVIYYEEKDKTEIRVTSLTPGQRLSLWVRGRIPIRGSIVRKGTSKLVLETRGRPRMTIRAVHAANGWEIHIPLPLKRTDLVDPKPKADPMLIRLERFDVETITGKACPRSEIPSDWLEPTEYSVFYDPKSDKTTLRVFPDEPGKSFELVVAGKTPAREHKIGAKGKIVTMKPKKPLIRMVRPGGRRIMHVDMVCPAVEAPAAAQERSVYCRQFACPVDQASGSFLGSADSKIRLSFDRHAYSVFYNEKDDVTRVKISSKFSGQMNEILLKGRLPLREYIENGDGKRTKCTYVKKPTIVISEQKVLGQSNVLKVTVMLPAKAPPKTAPGTEPPVVCETLPVQAFEGAYLEKVRTSVYFGKDQYRAVYDAVSKTTIIRLKSMDGHSKAETLVIAGRGGIADFELNSEGRLKKIANKVKPFISVFAEFDQKSGERKLFVRLLRQRKCRPRPGIPTDACLDNPDLIRIMMFDIGESEVAYDAVGNRFGGHLDKAIRKYAHFLLKNQAARNRYRARTRPPKSWNKGVPGNLQAGSAKYTARLASQCVPFDAAKAERIRRNNLGKKRSNDSKNRLRVTMENEINRGLNEMFALHTQSAFVFEDLSKNFHAVRGSKLMRQILSLWPRGIIQERLEFKAAERGVRLIYVPAAYSSQVCPRCGHVSRRNRHRDSFCCEFCGYEAHADVKAAAALGLRVHDPEFGRRMSMGRIRQFHGKEHAEFCAKMRKWNNLKKNNAVVTTKKRRQIEDNSLQPSFPVKKWPYPDAFRRAADLTDS